MKKFGAAIFLLAFLLPVHAFALMPNDPHYGQLWYLDKISAPSAWNITTGGTVVVAIIDGGVQVNHTDLAANIWTNTGEIAGNGIDDDGNGYIDDAHGWDFVAWDNDPSPDAFDPAGVDEDALSHGTMVAGMIGAVGNNGVGMTGLNWQVRLMPLRALNSVGAGTSNEVANAIDYAVRNGADIINLSFSGVETDAILENAIERAFDAGIVIVAALGNEDIDTDIIDVYPACLKNGNDDWVIGVAATDKVDKKASFSNYGPACTDLSAPGVDIFSTKFEDPANGYFGAYQGGWTGTSLSSPLVAGTAALILAAYPTLTPVDVRAILQLSVDPISLDEPLRDDMGAGRLNVARALQMGAEFVLANEPEIPVELPPAQYIKAPSFASVYRVAGNERRVFMNELAYFTWENSFAVIDEVPDSSLANYDLRGVMLPKPGVVLVKIQSDPRVYALAQNSSDPYAPKLRHITTEEIAITMYGAQWADYVIDVEPTFFGRFTSGNPILSPENVDTSIMKTRAQLAQFAN